MPGKTNKQYAPVSPKFPNVGAMQRNKLAPDVPARDVFVADPSAGYYSETDQGSNPGSPGRILDPQSASPDDKRTKPQSGPAGP